MTTGNPDDSPNAGGPLARMDPEPGAFELLAPGLQRTLWDMKWRELRSIQVQTIRAYLSTRANLLVMAETAGGKSEAAFLPVLSAIAQEPMGSVRAVYVGPLKALINDQFQRLEDLCRRLEIPVHRWHGDVDAGQKAKLVKEPGGVLLITPESIESLLINRTAHLPSLFGGLRAVVIDELHSFLEGERGLHLASLLTRLKRYTAPDQLPSRLIGLSATIGDPDAARRYLSPDDPSAVMVIQDPNETKELQLRIHVIPARVAGQAEDEDGDDGVHADQLRATAAELVERCRGASNLVFANRKADIELLADAANRMCRKEGLPEAFLVHHGSLAKEVREDTETMMKSGRPLTTICSSTLELGIDIGSVQQVCQVGAPWSVSSLKQRLGRSGRRDGEPRRLRVFVNLPDISAADHPLDELPLELLQALAVTDLLLHKQLDPPEPARCDLSTLTHQVISVIAETGGLAAQDLHTRLCVQGPFRHIETTLFIRVLRALAQANVIEQTPEGDLILGTPAGEDIRAERDFYAAFQTPTEFRVVWDERPIGTLPAMFVPEPDHHLILAGRRWLVRSVDSQRLVIAVEPARGAKTPIFAGQPGDTHPRIRERMRQILEADGVFEYLAPAGQAVLETARATARQAGLHKRGFRAINDKSTLWTTWTGTKAQRTLIAALRSNGIETKDRVVAIECSAPIERVAATVSRLAAVQIDPLLLAGAVTPKVFRKFDDLLPDDLLEVSIARDRFDLDSALAVCQSCRQIPSEAHPL